MTRVDHVIAVGDAVQMRRDVGVVKQVLGSGQHGHDSVPMNLITVVHQGKQMTLAEAAALAFEEEDQSEIDASVAGLIGYDRELSRPLDAHKVAAE